MSASQIITSVRAAASAPTSPTANACLLLASVLHDKFYPPMPHSFILSLYCLHGLFGLQIVVLVASLLIRAVRNRGDMWVFRTMSTARGTLIVPHFAVAWQICILVFCIVLQPNLQLTIQHAQGHDWRHYIAGRVAIFLPAWLATWAALWSLAVAVSLPRSGSVSGSGSGRAPWYTSPRVLNAHFIGGAVVAVVSICTSSFLSSHHYDASVAHYRTIQTAMTACSPRFSSMNVSEVDQIFAEQIFAEQLQGMQTMLEEMASFKADFRIAWAWWFILIVYAYGVSQEPLGIFVTVAIRYFAYLRKSLTKVIGVDGKNAERRALNRAWTFATLTSGLVSLTGCAYTGASLYVVLKVDDATSDAIALQAITIVSVYGQAIFGLVAACLALAQVVVSGSGDGDASTEGGGETRYAKGGQMGRQVHVSVHTQTQVESDSAVVQLELADWAKEAMDEKSSPKYAGL